jgi:hypothetical protein
MDITVEPIFRANQARIDEFIVRIGAYWSPGFLIGPLVLRVGFTTRGDQALVRIRRLRGVSRFGTAGEERRGEERRGEERRTLWKDECRIRQR